MGYSGSIPVSTGPTIFDYFHSLKKQTQIQNSVSKNIIGRNN